MAWTDQCKIAAVQTIDKVAEDMKVSVRKAIEEVSKEADIPAETLQKWYYPRSKSEAKNGPTLSAGKLIAGQRAEGSRFKGDAVHLTHNQPEPKEDKIEVCGEPPQPKRHTIMNGVVYDGPRYGDMAIEQLRCIKKEDPQRVATLVRVKAWIDDRLNQH